LRQADREVFMASDRASVVAVLEIVPAARSILARRFVLRRSWRSAADIDASRIASQRDRVGKISSLTWQGENAPLRTARRVESDEPGFIGPS
jgi:hypothetical protein